MEVGCHVAAEDTAEEGTGWQKRESNEPPRGFEKESKEKHGGQVRGPTPIGVTSFKCPRTLANSKEKEVTSTERLRFDVSLCRAKVVALLRACKEWRKDSRSARLPSVHIPNQHRQKPHNSDPNRRKPRGQTGAWRLFSNWKARFFPVSWVPICKTVFLRQYDKRGLLEETSIYVWMCRLSEFTSLRNCLQEWQPDIMGKLIELLRITIKALGVDARVNKVTQVSVGSTAN